MSSRPSTMTTKRRAGLRRLAVIATIAIAGAPLVASVPRATATPTTGLRLVGRLPDNARFGANGAFGENPQGLLLLDSTHRRAYTYALSKNGVGVTFHRFNVDAIDNTARTFIGSSLKSPGGVAFGPDGSLYIADTGNNRIAKVDATGALTTIAGTGAAAFSGDGGQAAAAALNGPRGIAFDTNGNLFIADTGNNRIRKVGTNGLISTVAGDGDAGFSGDGAAATAAALHAPEAIVVNPSPAHLFIADTGNNRIREVDAFSGNISTFAGNGTSGFAGDGGPPASAELAAPRGVAIDTPVLYIADTDNNRIREVPLVGGSISTYAGTGSAGFSGDGGKASAAQLNGPTGIRVTEHLGLFVADTGNGRVRTIRQNTGLIETAAGGGTGGDGSSASDVRLEGPTSVAADDGGNIYVAEQAADRVRRIGEGMQEILPPISLRQGKETASDHPDSAVDTTPVPMAVDPGSDPTSPSRIFYLSNQGIVYAVEPDSADRDASDPDLNPTVHAWTAGGNAASAALNLFQETNFAPAAASYDAGGTDPGSGIVRPQMLYLIGQVTRSGGSGHGLLIVGLDAANDPHEAADDFSHPQDRMKWSYVVHSCPVGGDNFASTAIARAGDWLYLFCDAYGDSQTKGIVRIKLTSSGGAAPQPDPSTEQFFPGVPGDQPSVAIDPATQRVYASNSTRGGRNVVVFDGRAAAGNGAYTGLISLSQTNNNFSYTGFDPGTGRWYFQSPEGLWYQDGRLRRVPQANRMTTAADDYDGTSATTESVDGYKPNLTRPIVVDPAVQDAAGTVQRAARIYVYRSNADQPACPVPGEGCWEVYQDDSPLPGTPPRPDEATLNVPEGPGLVGVYDGVASAYGARVRVMRGLSTLWPTGVPGVAPSTFSLEAAPTDSNPASYYTTDPFYYHAGTCGTDDREVTFGRVRQVQAHGDLFSKTASAEALGVDPDIVRPSAGTDTQTRDDLTNPDACTVGLMRTMTTPVCNLPDEPAFGAGYESLQQGWGAQCNPNADKFWTGVGSALAKGGQKWPYSVATCSGDDAPKATAESLDGLAPATAQVKCAASADTPSSEATAEAQLTPSALPVSVEDANATTKITRTNGQGIETTATSIVKGIDIAGQVHIDEMLVTGTSRAKGYCASEIADCSKGLDPKAKSAPQVSYDRKFFGVTAGGNRMCDDSTVCDTKQVVAAINLALGSQGYAAAADPEQDVTQGTVKGTLGVFQKDQVLQDSDSITNADFSTEWPGLEIIIFRDGVQRGWGRWELQLGGVFTSAQMGVVTAPADITNPGPSNNGGGSSGTPAIPGRTIGGTSKPGIAAVPAHQILLANGAAGFTSPSAVAQSVAGGAPTTLQRIAHGVERSLKAALLLLALWGLVYAPVYVARRREFLREVMSQS